MNPPRPVRLCLKDLYHQDVVEMIERETRRYSMSAIEDASDPDFDVAFDLLWEAFGEAGEMERKETVRSWMGDDPFIPLPNGSFLRYYLLIAKDQDGNIRGVRDGMVLLNPNYAPELCVVYLAHIYMLPSARGTVLSYWLRIAPVEIAMQYMADLHARGLFSLPAPDQPVRNFGMQIDLVAEMEYFTPDERISWQRILFYGRGGFDAINPRHFPFQQPDFRDSELIRQSGHQPLPFMLLVRRMGRERVATIPITEAMAITRLMYDDHATYCDPEAMEPSYGLLMRRLEERAKEKNYVALLPLPTGPQNLNRIRRLFRYTVFRLFYPNAPATRVYLESGIKEKLAENPRYLDQAIEAIRVELASRKSDIYASREKGFTWDGTPVSAHELAAEAADPATTEFTEDPTLTRNPERWAF